MHEEPYVLVVPDFLSAPVCEALIRKMDAHHAQPSDGATLERGRTRVSHTGLEPQASRQGRRQVY